MSFTFPTQDAATATGVPVLVDVQLGSILPISSALNLQSFQTNSRSQRFSLFLSGVHRKPKTPPELGPGMFSKATLELERL